MYDTCFICETPMPGFEWADGKVINCAVCGEYEPLEPFLQKRHDHGLENNYLLSGALRENYEKGIIFRIESSKQLLDSVLIPKTPLEKIDRILLFIAKKTDFINKGVKYKSAMFAIVYAKDELEFNYYFANAQELGYIDKNSIHGYLRLSIKGWERVAEISKLQPNSNQAFVAMSFNPELYYIWENGFEPALKEVGYDAIRVDTVQTNGKIDDKIIADIRKSGLVVADFTGHKNGVYFETGFAMGLEIPLIWTCREDSINDSHFDTRQYNHILWNDSYDLRIKL
jgi:nucleoside 2-deoxyribosyltransferase